MTWVSQKKIRILHQDLFALDAEIDVKTDIVESLVGHGKCPWQARRATQNPRNNYMCQITRPQDRNELRRLMDDIGQEYCHPERYCIFKEFLIAAHTSRRLLFQLKAADKRKYELSEKEGKDIGWSRTMEIWVEDGYAKAFAEAYSDDRSFREVYSITMSIWTKTKDALTLATGIKAKKAKKIKK